MSENDCAGTTKVAVKVMERNAWKGKIWGDLGKQTQKARTSHVGADCSKYTGSSNRESPIAGGEHKMLAQAVQLAINFEYQRPKGRNVTCSRHQELPCREFSRCFSSCLSHWLKLIKCFSPRSATGEKCRLTWLCFVGLSVNDCLIDPSMLFLLDGKITPSYLAWSGFQNM